MVIKRVKSGWVRAVLTGSAAAIAVGIAGMSFTYRVAVEDSRLNIRDVAGMFTYIVYWAMLPAGLAAGAASLALDKLQTQERYSLKEIQRLAIEQGVAPEMVAELMVMADKDDD